MRSYIVIAALLLTQNVYGLSEGDACSPRDRMPHHLVCFDNTVNDCRNPQGRLGYIVCAGTEMNQLEREMSSLYAKALRALDGPAGEGMRFENARVALIESQKAWVRYAEADCDLGEALFGPGNGGAPVAMDCQVNHLKSRIRKLLALPIGGK